MTTTTTLPSLPSGWEVKTQHKTRPRPVMEYHIYQENHLVTRLSFHPTADKNRVALHILTTIKEQLT